MTPGAVKALQWFADNGPIGWFDRMAPSKAMRARLQTEEWIEEVRELRRPLRDPLRYQITDAGRKALEAATAGKPSAKPPAR